VWIYQVGNSITIRTAEHVKGIRFWASYHLQLFSVMPCHGRCNDYVYCRHVILMLLRDTVLIFTMRYYFVYYPVQPAGLVLPRQLCKDDIVVKLPKMGWDNCSRINTVTCSIAIWFIHRSFEIVVMLCCWNHLYLSHCLTTLKTGDLF
jgi:hypothetical protein